MIVGTKDIDAADVLRHCKDVETLRNYSELLVPRIIRHDRRIVSNQKYCVAMIVRDLKSIPYARRKELYEGLLEDVSIFGVANMWYDFDDIMAEIDIDKLACFILQGGE